VLTLICFFFGWKVEKCKNDRLKLELREAELQREIAEIAVQKEDINMRVQRLYSQLSLITGNTADNDWFEFQKTIYGIL